MAFFEFQNVGPLERLVLGGRSKRALTLSVVYLEAALERALFESKRYQPLRVSNRLRLVGEIDDVTVHLAWIPGPAGRHYVMLAPTLVKALQLKLGDSVTLRFNLVSPESVDVPDDLRADLASNRVHARVFAALTPGAQRGLVALLSRVKTPAGRQRKIISLFEALGRGESLFARRRD
jgi:Bacteriocin-protection, YdeI or OmpD-Associated